MHKVFVYGTLLSDMGNNHLLENATFLGVARTKPNFLMLDIGYFPGVIESNNGTSIIGEVYEVDDETLYRLDRLEGYKASDPKGGLYNKKEIDTEFGTATIYIYNNPFGRVPNRQVANGDWRTYCNLKLRR